jgi:glutaminyl-tRNA synthetase
VEEPGAGDVDYLTQLNGDSLKVVQAFMEPALNDVKVGETVQFERQGYFCKDKDSSAEKTVFNRTVALKDSWAKKAK